MKKILIQTPYRTFANNNMFSVDPANDGNNTFTRWVSLKKELGELGYELMTADENSLDDCEGIIFHDSLSISGVQYKSVKIKNFIKKIIGKKIPETYPTRDLYGEAIKRGMRDKMFLLLWEAKATFPLNFSKEILDKFDHVITWNDDMINEDPKKFIRFYMPMEIYPEIERPLPFNQKKLLVNISHNKYYNFHKNELYSERRKLSTYFDKHYPNDFDLFGFQWNKPATRAQRIFPFLVKQYRTYRGYTKNKIETLSKYKFNLCFDNISDANGYIADRMFNTFHAKSVPIHWGAPNVDQYIDPDTFIDRRKFKNNEELANFLVNMKEDEYNKYLVAAERYMKSQKYENFKPQNFSKTIIRALGIKS